MTSSTAANHEAAAPEQGNALLTLPLAPARRDDLVHSRYDEPGGTASSRLGAWADDGVGVEVDPRSEEATHAPEGPVEPCEVSRRVHS